MLQPDDIKLMRNTRENLKELERLFGTMGAGMAFGESCMFGNDAASLMDRNKFYNPIALTESYYLTLNMRDYQKVLKNIEEQMQRD